jgi:hypothetical protein
MSIPIQEQIRWLIEFGSAQDRTAYQMNAEYFSAIMESLEKLKAIQIGQPNPNIFQCVLPSWYPQWMKKSVHCEFTIEEIYQAFAKRARAEKWVQP